MKDFFRETDSFLKHLEETVTLINDDYLKSQYVGIVAVKAVSAYEVAVKTLLIDYARNIHPIVLKFAEDQYQKLSARISRDEIKKYLELYGKNILNQFKFIEDTKDARGGVKSSFTSLQTWRHYFVHQNELHPNQQQSTFEESIKAYELGKGVIYALAEALDLL